MNDKQYFSGNMYYNYQFSEVSKDQMEKLVDEIKSLRSTLFKYEEIIDKLRQDKILAKKNLEELQKQFEESQNESSQRQSMIDSLNKKINLMEKLQENTKNANYNQMEVLQRTQYEYEAKNHEILELRSQNEQLNAKLIVSNTNLQNSQEQIKNLKIGYELEINQLNSQLSKLLSENKKNQGERQSVMGEQDKFKRRIEELEKSNLTLQSKIKEKEFLIKGMQDEMRQDKFERDKIIKNDSIQYDDTQLQGKLRAMEEALNKLQNEKQKLENQLNQANQTPISQEYVKDQQIKIEQLVKEQKENNEKIQKIEKQQQDASKNDFDNIKQLQKSLQDLRVQNNLLQQELTSTKQLKQAQDQLINNLKKNRGQELSSLEKNIESLTSQILQLQEQLSAEKNNVKKLNLLLTQNSEEFKNKEEKLNSLLESRTKEVNILEDFLKKKDFDNKNHTICENRNNHLIKENSDLKKINLEKSKQIESMKDELVQLEKQYELENQNNLKKLEQSLQFVFNQELNDTKSRLQETIYELENDVKRQQDRNTLYESKLQTLREKADDSNKNYAIRSQELQNLMIQTSESNRISQVLGRQERENQDLREQVEQMKDVIQNLQFELKKSTQYIDLTESKFQDNQIFKLQNDFDIQTKIIAQKEQDIQAKLRIIQELKLENQKQSDNFNYNLLQLQEEIQKFKNSYSLEQDSHIKTKQRLSILEQRLTEAENWIVEYQKIRLDLEQEIKGLYLQLNELNQFKILYEQLNYQEKSNQSTIFQFQQQIQEKEINIRDFQDIIKLQQEKIQDLGGYIEQLQVQIRSYQQQIESINYQNTCEKDEFKIKFQKIQNELEETKHLYAQSQSNEVKRFKQEIWDLKQNNQVVEESWNQRYNSFQQELKDKNYQIQQLTSQLHLMQNYQNILEQQKIEINNYQLRCSDLETIIKEIVSKNETLETNINSLHTQLNDKNSYISQLNILLQQNKLELSRITLDKQVLEEQIQKQQIQDKQKISLLMQEKDQLIEEDLVSLKEQLRIKISKIKELENDILVLSQLQGENKTLQQNVEYLENQCRSYSKQYDSLRLEFEQFQFEIKTSGIQEYEIELKNLRQQILDLKQQDNSQQLNKYIQNQREHLKIIQRQEEDLEKWRNNYFKKEKQLESFIKQHEEFVLKQCNNLEQINNEKIVQNTAEHNNIENVKVYLNSINEIQKENQDLKQEITRISQQNKQNKEIDEGVSNTRIVLKAQRTGERNKTVTVTQTTSQF